MNGIDFKYRGSDELILNQVAFGMEQGHILAIVGESGSGKSTTLRVLAGLETPLSGEISVGGKDFYSGKTNLLPEERGLGMVFQDYALFPHLTVEKNIMFGLEKMRRKRRKKEWMKCLPLLT